jgi:hypothetical protein
MGIDTSMITPNKENSKSFFSNISAEGQTPLFPDGNHVLGAASDDMDNIKFIDELLQENDENKKTTAGNSHNVSQTSTNNQGK